MVATRSHDFFLFAVPWHFPGSLRLTTAIPFFCCRLLTAYQATLPHIPILPLKATTFLRWFSLGFVTPRFRSTDFFCSLFSSFVFHHLHRRYSPSANRTLFSNQSSLPLVPFSSNRRPRRFKQQPYRITVTAAKWRDNAAG